MAIFKEILTLEHFCIDKNKYGKWQVWYYNKCRPIMIREISATEKRQLLDLIPDARLAQLIEYLEDYNDAHEYDGWGNYMGGVEL